MLQEQVEGRPVEAADIDAPGIDQFLAEVRADDPFVPRLGAESRLSQPGVDPEVQVYRAGVKCRTPFPSDLMDAKVFSVCSNWSSNLAL